MPRFPSAARRAPAPLWLSFGDRHQHQPIEARFGQEDLVAANPEHFFVPPYVGKAGWLGIRLDKGLAWGIVASLVRDGYLEIAPKTLRAMLVAKP